MDSSSINLSPAPPPPPPPHGFPPPHHSLHHLTPPPLPPLLDLGIESSARPLPRKPKHKPSSNGFSPHGGHPPGLFPKPRPPRKPDTAAKTTPPCTECGKRFSSWKALFGHMRCHPERQWRGINPPPHLRRLPLLPGPPPPERFTGEEHEVASILIMLSCGPRADTDGVGAVRSLSTGHGGWKRAWDEREAMRGYHKCNAYSRGLGLSAGQAHGGHNRRHWKRGEEGCSSSKKYVLDLNLPPPLESNEGNPSAVLDLRLGI